MKAHFYLNFPGNTEEAFSFYQKTLGGELGGTMRYSEVPGMPPLSEGDQEKIMHISLQVGNGMLLMGTDLLESMGHKCSAGNNLHISLAPTSRKEADEIFAGLSEGGTVTMPMKEMFWGDYFGSFSDRYGINWMINC